jgi:tRNA (guanine37-N1)-methyltransferase
MKITVISLFPEMFEPVMSTSMMRKAREGGQLEFATVNLRDFGHGPRRTVDDAPYGGGDGMLLKPEPVVAAIESVTSQDDDAYVVLMSPQGQRLDQQLAQSLSDSKQHLVLVCGRYEGFDERIRSYADAQISIGDYVLTGGELPAMVIADAVVRLIPGVLGGDESAEIESFSDGQTLEFPQYTRPEEFRGVKVPDVLLSGHHGEIAKWREQQAATRLDNAT